MTKRGQTKEYEGLDSGTIYTFARPTWSTMTAEALSLEPIIFDVATKDIFGYQSTIKSVLMAAAYNDDTRNAVAELFESGTYEEVVEVLDAYMEHARFVDFFNSRDEKMRKIRKARRDEEHEIQVKQMRILLEAGLSENGVLDLVRDTMQATQTGVLPSLDSSPPNIIGLEGK